MSDLHLQALGLLALSLTGTLVIGRAMRRQKLVHRRYFAWFGAFSLLAFLGIIPGFTKSMKIALPTSESGAWMLTLGVLAFSVCLGMLFVGRTELTKIARSVVARIRTALEERANPQLRARNACIREYDRAIGLMAMPVEGRPERLRRNRLASVLVFKNLTDEDIDTLANYCNVAMLDGKGNKGQLMRFFEEERRLAHEQPLEVSGHGTRLTRLIGRLQREIAA